MLKFTSNVREWMSQDEKNVIAIHCKGGKGRISHVQSVYATNHAYLLIVASLIQVWP